MAFFYDIPININTGIKFPSILPTVTSTNGRNYAATFESSTPVRDSFCNRQNPLDASESRIQELAMSNPRIRQIMADNHFENFQ